MSSPLVALIFGSGPRVGASVVESLQAKGYKVATVSRKKLSTAGVLSLTADLADTDKIPSIFDAVKKEFGAAPSVVAIVAAGYTDPGQDIFSLTADQMAKDFKINTVAPYVAAGEAVKGWKTLPAGTKGTFIYTGNFLNTVTLPVPMMVEIGIGKAATAYWVGSAAQIYEKEGYKFYYADERKADGSGASFDLDGPAHGEFYAQLVDQPAGVPWQATFVKGKGYVKF